MSVDHGAPPVIPTNLLPYQSYDLDPKWQGRFTFMWGGAVALFLVLAAPRALRLRSLREAARNFPGVQVRSGYEAVPCCVDEGPDEGGERANEKAETQQPASGLTVLGRVLRSVGLWNLPGLPLNAGQICIVGGYALFTIFCVVFQVPLETSPNRAGFIALAQLTPVFLFAAKNSPLTMLLLGPGVDYTKLNYIHRWSARFLLLAALVHGAIWISNHIAYDLPILTQQKEGSGVAALATLCVVALTSVSPLRRWCYSAFLVCHYLTFPAFFITICYHTIYAVPWIVPPLAFYAADLLLRFARWRVVVGRIEARGPEGKGGMSLIHIPLAQTGWRAGQHVQVRAIVGARAWEAHPLSICCAPPGEGCLTGPDGRPLGMLLGARACGDWSRALHAYALEPEPSVYVFDDDEDAEDTIEKDIEAATSTPDVITHEKRVDVSPSPSHHNEEQDEPGRDTHLILEGPYGGPTLHPDEFESVLLFAGGSGATYTLGVLDALVARCVPLPSSTAVPLAPIPKTRRVVWCWCVRSFGAIKWFAPYLLQIATRAAHPSSTLDLRIRIFVTCLCDPDAVPRIPGCTVTEAKPDVRRVLEGMLDVSCPDDFDCHGPKEGKKSLSSSENSSTEDLPTLNATPDPRTVDIERRGGGDEERVAPRGGVAVFAAGPGSLIQEAGNAVARANMGAHGRRAGGVAFCSEAFTV